MVRTRANNAAVRKAVAAKAPRKQVGGGGVRVSASPSSIGKGKKPRMGCGGNPVKEWPTPAWQKGIDIFLSPNSRGRSRDKIGTLSGCGTSSSTLSDDELVVVRTTGDSKKDDVTSDGEEVEDIEEEDDDEVGEEDEDEEEEVEEEEEGATRQIELLSKDIATCGSDSDDD